MVADALGGDTTEDDRTTKAPVVEALRHATMAVSRRDKIVDFMVTTGCDFQKK